ncbi:MAG TPA: type II secretion system protein GspM [Gammaproteobacteria bacterium]|jgi:type II secretory pathway component PulM|nr:type II secretion system protein GspM [Gammaproteobacteria bacterium]
MQEKWLKMIAWWSVLARREQYVVGLGALFVSLFFVYQLVISPLFSHVDALRQRLGQDEETLRWMQSVDKAMDGQSLRDGKSVGSAVALLAMLQKALTHAELSTFIVQLKQAANGSVVVIFHQVPFSRLIKWLVILKKNYPLQIAQMKVEGSGDLGLVDVEVTIA